MITRFGPSDTPENQCQIAAPQLPGLFCPRTTFQGTPVQTERHGMTKGTGGGCLMKYVLFSYEGRISRSQYWTVGIFPLLALAFLWGITFIPVSYLFPWVSILVSIGVILCLVWGFTAVSVKRCHDMGYFRFLDSPLPPARSRPVGPDRVGDVELRRPQQVRPNR